MKTSTLATVTKMVEASDELMAIMRSLLSANLVLFILGLVCALINVLLLYTLLSSKKLRKESMLLICLAVGDFANCVAYSMMGYERYSLFIRSLSTGMIPLETSLTCASKPFMWFRVIGNVWPPAVMAIMGVERLVASLMPIFYAKHLRDRSAQLSLLSLMTVVVFCSIGLSLAITNASRGYVKFDCGRKATFSVPYAQSLYYWEMLGFFIGLLLNIVAYVRVKYVLSNALIREQLRRIRYGLVLSVLSTLLVSIPNMKSLFLQELRFAGMDEWLSQMFNWSSIINSSSNIFVYIWLHRDFRRRFSTILRSQFKLFGNKSGLFKKRVHSLLVCNRMLCAGPPTGSFEVRYIKSSSMYHRSITCGPCVTTS